VLRATAAPDLSAEHVLVGAKLLMAVWDHRGGLFLAERARTMPGGAEQGAALRFAIEHRLGFYRESGTTLAQLDVARHFELHERQLRVLLRVGDLDGAAELLERLLAVRPEDEALLRVRTEIEARRAVTMSGSPRDDGRVVLDTIRTAEPASVLARLEAVHDRYPTSGLSWAHHGEALTWLGRHEEARVSLERAIAVERRTRWPYYGLGVLHLVAGRAEEAIEMCARGYEAMGNTDTPFEQAVRGEALRLLGRLDDARAKLEIAVAAAPRRLSTHVNLGLLHAEAGRPHEMEERFRHVAEHAPALLVAAAADCGVDLWRAEPGLPPWAGLDHDERARILAAVLSRMHGNRSASCLTWLNADGVIRTVDGPIPDVAARHLEDARRLLQRPGVAPGALS
jgi:tetratricopeptide (TPR) repeat protein